MRRVCAPCEGTGKKASHEIVGHNEREWQVITCYSCQGTGWRDKEEEKRAAGARLANAFDRVKRAKKELSEANKHLRTTKAAAKKVGVW